MNNNRPGFTPISDEEPSPEAAVNAIEQNQQAPQQEMQQPEQAQQQQPQAEGGLRPGLTPIEEESPEQEAADVEQQTEKDLGFWASIEKGSEDIEKSVQEITDEYYEPFNKGLSESASGEAAKLLFNSMPEGNQTLVKDPSLWRNIVEGAGTLTGDLPFLMAGSAMGAAIGSVQGPIGTVTGAGFGAMAFPAMLKESMRQYREFIDSGNDATFGEFIQRLDPVVNRTLFEGSLGVAMGAVQSALPVLKTIPYIKDIFDTRYVGTPIRKATELGLETATAVTLPSISQGQIPKPEDFAQAVILFTGMKAAHLPSQLPDIIANYKSSGINLALAEQIQQQNLAYPPRQELQAGKTNQVYRNSVELDRNITAFDESFVNNLREKVDALSPTDIASTHDAGTILKTILMGTTPDTAPVVPPEPGVTRLSPGPTTEVPATNIPEAPKRRVIPLIRNPIVEGLNTISPTGFASDVAGGRILRETFFENREADVAPLNRRYTNLRTNSKDASFFDTEFADTVQDFIEHYEGSTIPGGQASALLQAARRLRDMFNIRNDKGEWTGPLNVKVDNLIKTNRDIKDLVTWDEPRTVQDRLTELISQVDELIVKQLNEFSPELGNEYTNLNGAYRDFKLRYDNKDTRIFFDRTVQSKAIHDKFLDIDYFNQYTQAFETSPKGRQVLNQMRRTVWDQRLGNDVLKATNEKGFTDALSKKFDTLDPQDRGFNNLMEFLEPMQQADMTRSAGRVNQLREATRTATEAHSAEQAEYDYLVNKRKSGHQSEIAIQKARKKAQVAAEKEYEAIQKLKSKEAQEAAREVQDKQGLLTSILKQDPVELINNVKTVESIDRTWKALEKVKGGKEVKASLARFETNEMLRFLGEGYIRTGRVPYSDLKIQLTRKDFRAKLKALNGEEFVTSLDQLVKLTDSLSDSFLQTKIKFAADPVALGSVVNIHTALGILSGEPISALATGTAIKTTMKGLNKAQNMWQNKNNYDQAHITEMIDAAKALKSKNRDAIVKEAMRIAPLSTKK